MSCSQDLEECVSNDDSSDNSYLCNGDKKTNTSDDSDNDEDDKSTQFHKPIKKQPIKSQKLPLKEAIKTVEERSLYIKIDKFFNTECDYNTVQKMVKIIENNNYISLRLLNWFAMKYSATMQSLEITDVNGNVELFDVKISYRARLDTHSKKYFDPFRRGRKFDYQYDKIDKIKTVETTLCQLNFFRWLFMHDLLDYVEEYYELLKNKMGTFNNGEKKKKEVKKEKEKIKIRNIKKKKADVKLKIKKFTEDSTNKLVIIM